MKKKFDSEYIRKLAEEMSKNSSVSYDDLPKYDLFLSQVIDYLNDKFKGERFTNNIVQNYTKSEVITKPEDGKKRGYTKMHLIQLVLLGYMRPVLNTEEIKKVFSLAFNDINDGLSSDVKNEIKMDTAFWRKYKGGISKVYNKVYDVLLKIGGQEDGIKSYNGVVKLIVSTYKEEWQ